MERCWGDTDDRAWTSTDDREWYILCAYVTGLMFMEVESLQPEIKFEE